MKGLFGNEHNSGLHKNQHSNGRIEDFDIGLLLTGQMGSQK